MNFCVYCGTELDMMDAVCPECGAEVLDPPHGFISFDSVRNDLENIQNEPENNTYEPLSPGDCMLAVFLLSIPILGQIIAMVWALGASTNRNRRNLAAGMLLLQVILAAVCVGLYFFLDYFHPVWMTNFIEALKEIVSCFI